VRFTETPLAGAFVIELDLIRDQRGYFARTFDASAFEEAGLDAAVVQCNTSFNAAAGTVRGMHYQADPDGEAKLVRCTRGAVFDVALDLRAGSPTYCRWFGTELTADNGRMVYIPVGMAHGYQTLAADTEVHYQVSHHYVPGRERGVRFDDPAFGIDWPLPPAVVSERDRAFPDFRP
jgi:dTDP-4-dehydrorhamnose 3,5-epimerase